MTLENTARHCLRLLLAISTLTTMAAASSSGGKSQVTGEAFDLQSDKFLYREIYCDNPDPRATEVIYRDDKKRLLARKRLDYSSGATTPSFVQQNYYSSEVIEVDLDAGNVTMSVFDAIDAEPKKVSSVQTDGSLPIVIDAGFDAFIRQNWSRLVAGEKKRFLFPFVERDSLVELRVRKAACSYPSTHQQCFKLELSNWFARMLVSPIELGYDSESQRLMRYRGLSNIGDGKGNGLVVDIHYDYRQAPELACAAGEQVTIDSSVSTRDEPA